MTFYPSNKYYKYRVSVDGVSKLTNQFRGGYRRILGIKGTSFSYVQVIFVLCD